MKKYYILLVLMLMVGCSTIPSTSSGSVGLGTTPEFSDLVPTSDYVIYSDCATLPTLYMGINMMTHNKTNLYVYGTSKNTRCYQNA